jgi:MFS family permease
MKKRTSSRPSWLRIPQGDLFADRDIRLLFGAQGVSMLGSQVSNIAIPLIAIDVIHASDGGVALIEGAFLLSYVLFSLPVGALLDRRTRRPVLIAMDLARMGLLLALPVSYALGALSMGLLYIVAFFLGFGSLIYDVAHQSYLPALLKGPRLAAANSRLMVLDSAASITGPSIAGIAVGRFGGPFAIILDSLSYLASALLLRRVQHVEVPPAYAADSAPRVSLRSEMREGLAWVLGHPHLRGNALAALTMNFFAGIANGGVMIAYARRELLLPAELIGIILGAGVIGLILGSLSSARIAERIGVGRSIIVGAAILPIFPLVLALLNTGIGSAGIALIAIGGQIVAYFGAALFHSNQITYRQLITPKRLLGRMNASMKWVMLLGMPLGTVVGALIADAAGLRAALFAGAIGIIFGPLPLFFSGIAAVKRQPSHTIE